MTASPIVDEAEQRRQTLAAAHKKWADAPAHVRLMAGAYVEPVLAVLDAVGRELDARKGGVQ